MRAVILMFDTLNKHMLPNYGCGWIHAPNFQRLGGRTVTFDRCYAGSLPCMPARRELHTGRYNFLHRSWGPLEPFDDSMVEVMKANGVYTHLSTDHGHYFRDGGATYHTRFNTWEFARGQEGDPWKGSVRDPAIPESASGRKLGDLWRQDWVNRSHIQKEEDFPLAVTVRRGLEFLESNADQDRWFLQIECFDPHEPFFTPQKYKDLYPHEYRGRHFDWPDYDKVTEGEEEARHAVFEYAALVSMCDEYLGKVLDAFDRLNLWKDTMLIVNTDHGFLLGEHRWWGKNIQPFYNEIANLPLFIWDPRHQAANVRSDALVQTIDIAPTLLDFFGAEIPNDMTGRPLGDVLRLGTEIRKAALFGIHGGHVNCTDGRYVYMRAPAGMDNGPLYEYTLMPTHLHTPFSVTELSDMVLSEPFSFTKGCRVLKIAARPFLNPYVYGTMLFDLEQDPKQQNPIENIEIEQYMIRLMAECMAEHDAPPEQYERIGIPEDGIVTEERLLEEKRERESRKQACLGIGEQWAGASREVYFYLKTYTPPQARSQLDARFAAYLNKTGKKLIREEDICDFVKATMGERSGMMIRLIRAAAL